MPSGGQSPIDDGIREQVMACYNRAAQYGLQQEWFSYFLGGIVEKRNSPDFNIVEQAELACIEWDV